MQEDSLRTPFAKTMLMLLAAGAGLLAYILLFILKRQLAPSVNVLIECLLILVLLMPIAMAVYVLLYKKRILTLEGAVGAAMIFIFSSTCFYFTVPAVVDRSVTLYLINLLDNHEEGMSLEEIREEFIEVYFYKSRGIEKRLNEQLDSGNISRDSNGIYQLTNSGRFTIGTARVLSYIHSLDPRIVEKTKKIPPPKKAESAFFDSPSRGELYVERCGRGYGLRCTGILHGSVQQCHPRFTHEATVMKLAVVGTGYVGLVTGACLAEMGNIVTCVDIDEAKLAQIKSGHLPIHEPGLNEMVAENTAMQRLHFTSDLSAALTGAEVAFITVGTPPQQDGSVDTSYMFAAATSIGEALQAPIIVVSKSTAPVGTAEKIESIIAAKLKARQADIAFSVASNPEFLREGSAVNDFMYPDRIVIGATNEHSAKTLEALYDPFSKKKKRIQIVSARDAEMIKYAANAMLAVRVSVMNELALMCDEYGVDVENVRLGIGSDPRIGSEFIYPGIGYGGSCLPKDMHAIINMADAMGLHDTILEAADRRNQQQQLVLINKITKHFGGDIASKRFALWGLAFKPNTDDIRSAPAIAIAKSLSDLGASVIAYDPQAMPQARQALANANTEFADSPYAATEGADALIVVTEWRQFRQPDFPRLSRQLSGAVIFDGRNLYNPKHCAEHGLHCVGMGRSSAQAQALASHCRKGYHSQ
ncbi:MAG: UDP-glucose dehydrogenase family protein [Pseudomonadales bacterium]